MLKREKLEKPKGQVSNNKIKQPKKETLFIRILNRLLKLKFLKLLELSIGFVKGFVVKIEFFEDKTQNNKEKNNG